MPYLPPEAWVYLGSMALIVGSVAAHVWLYRAINRATTLPAVTR